MRRLLLALCAALLALSAHRCHEKAGKISERRRSCLPDQFSRALGAGEPHEYCEGPRVVDWKRRRIVHGVIEASGRRPEDPRRYVYRKRQGAHVAFPA